MAVGGVVASARVQDNAASRRCRHTHITSSSISRKKPWRSVNFQDTEVRWMVLAGAVYSDAGSAVRRCVCTFGKNCHWKDSSAMPLPLRCKNSNMTFF